ncbi:hypothetical protein IID62_10830, partial [candidate division KSB1 bacterium]|nr:hypothetical protein [candidate division KSB1 bacterium]
MNNPIKCNRNIFPRIVRQFGIHTRSPILKALIPLLMVFLHFGKPLYVIERISYPVAVTKSDTLLSNQFTGLIEDVGSYVFSPVDTSAVSEGVSHVRNGQGGTFIFQSGQNYFDVVSGSFLKRDLNPRAVRSIDAHADTSDYEVRDNLVRRFNKGL